MTVLERILVALVEEVGIPFVMRVIAARTPRDVASAALDAEYDAIRTATDAEARRVLGGP